MSCAYVSRDTPRGGAWQKGSTRDSLSTEDGAVKFPTGQGDITDWTGLVFLGCMPGRGGQVAGGRAHPVPRMSPGVTSSYLYGCGVSPQPLPSSPIFIVLWEAPQKTGCRQAPTTSGRTKKNRKRICVGGPKRYRVGQKFRSGFSIRSE